MYHAYPCFILTRVTSIWNAEGMYHVYPHVIITCIAYKTSIRFYFIFIHWSYISLFFLYFPSIVTTDYHNKPYYTIFTYIILNKTKITRHKQDQQNQKRKQTEREKLRERESEWRSEWRWRWCGGISDRATRSKANLFLPPCFNLLFLVLYFIVLIFLWLEIVVMLVFDKVWFVLESEGGD
jgi:hypothetical protein